MTKTGVLPGNTPVFSAKKMLSAKSAPPQKKRKYKNFINSAWTNQENTSKFRIIWIYEQSKKKTSGMEAITKEKRRKNYEGEHGTI